ncbi:MAG TPA: hypothetical protein G4O10_02355 [Dehalococcoidia bacterium]|nr:hypothetical protein [Dehalococcoidia bacterium]
MAEYKELLGKKFQVVQNGLDPNEVTEYLMREVGSSDTVFRQLEQFSALQAATKTIDDAIKQARDLAEHAKVKATAEAEQRKAQAVEEGKKLAAKIINEAGTSVLAYFDNASSIMMEAMNEAFKKTKDQVSGDRAKTREKIEKAVGAGISQVMTDMENPAKESSDTQPESTNPSPTNKAASVASSASSDPWEDSR